MGKEEKKSLRNCLVVLFLGCIPNFNVQLCLELVKKFVVGGGGGWWWLAIHILINDILQQLVLYDYLTMCCTFEL